MDDLIEKIEDTLERIFDGFAYVLVWLSVILGALTILFQLIMYSGRHI